MRNIIKDRQIVADDWNVLKLEEGQAPESVTVAAGKVLVPLKVWQAQRAALSSRADVGVWIDSDETADALKDDAAKLPLIAVNFPKFADGRGYSIAYNLRARLKYAGELRAIGDVLRDQLFYMQRAGFNAFAVREDKDINDALKGLSDFSQPYQNSVDIKAPLWRRVHRSGASA